MVINRGKVSTSVLPIETVRDSFIIIKHHIDNVFLLVSHEISKVIGILF